MDLFFIFFIFLYTDALTAQFKDLPNQPREAYIHMPGLNVDYKLLMPCHIAYDVFDRLEKEVIYLKDQKVRIFGAYYEIPRKHAAYGDNGVQYTFSGLTVNAKPWTALLEKIRDMVSAETGHKYNFVLVNRYANGSDSIGFHSDDEREIDPLVPIACVSFGSQRRFVLKSKKVIQPRCFTKMLESGSLLLMHAPTNSRYLHSIPRCASFVGPRVSLTFRNIIPAHAR